jgi:hypothetical protein
MDEPIAKLVRYGCSAFQTSISKEQKWIEAQVRITNVQDQFSRFKLWVGNLGAHRTGQSSLEYRLRDASHIKSQVQRLLTHLNEALHDAESILNGDKLPWDKLPDDEDDSDDDDLDDMSRNGRDCEVADQTHDFRHQWMNHVTQFHWKTWHCQPARSTSTQLPALLSTSKSPQRRIPGSRNR